MAETGIVAVDVQSFEKRHEQEVIDLIVGIQQNEFSIPITAADQPDLMDIQGLYQKKHGNFWVATCENRVVGTIALLDISNRMAALRKMFVHPSFRGNASGTGQRLLSTLLRWAESHRIRTIFLGTTAKFLAAHRFYEKNGFREIMQSALPPTFPVMKVDTKFYQFDIIDEYDK